MANSIRSAAAQLFAADTPMGRIARNTGWLLGGKAVGAVLSLLYLAMATRTLGLVNFGTFTLILTASQFLTRLVTFDSWQAIVKYGQQPLVNGDRARLGDLVGVTVGIELVSALVGTVIAVVVAFGLGSMFAWSQQTQYWAVAYSAIALFAIRSTPVGILRLLDKFSIGAFADSMTPISRMIGASLAALFMPTVIGFLLAWAASEVVVAAVYWIMVYRHGRTAIGRPRLAALWTAGQKFPAMGRFLWATNITVTLSSVTSFGPILLLGMMVGAAEAGYFRLASQLSNALVMVAQMMSRTVFTEMARSHERRDADTAKLELGHTLRHSLLMTMVGAVIVVLLTWLLGQPLLLLMAGPEFQPAYPILLLLSIAAAIEFAGLSFAPVLMATDRVRTAVYVRLAGIGLLAVLLFILLPMPGNYGGVRGAAYAVIGSNLVQFLLNAVAVRRILLP